MKTYIWVNTLLKSYGVDVVIVNAPNLEAANQGFMTEYDIHRASGSEDLYHFTEAPEPTQVLDAGDNTYTAFYPE